MIQNRHRELAHRAQANSQRRAREALLAVLPPQLVPILSRAECIYSPNADRFLRQVMPARARIVGPAFYFIETEWPDEVRCEIAAAPRSWEFDPAILVLPEICEVHFGENSELVPDLPLFKVRYGEARRALEMLWCPRSGFTGAFLETLGAGLVVDSYSGYPTLDPGPEDCTYEVASWGAA